MTETVDSSHSSTGLKLLVVVVFSSFLVLVYWLFFNPNESDFRIFYSTAQMLRHGQRKNFYDLVLQANFQIQFFGNVNLVFNYPPLTALLCLPLAFLNVTRAYLFWIVLNMGILGFCSVQLNRHLHVFQDAGIFYFVSFLFMPVHFLMLGGQVDGFLLLAYVLSFVATKAERPFASGLALTIGLVKFHLLIPFVALLFFRRQWRWLLGFFVGSFCFVALCVLLSGVSFFEKYYNLLSNLKNIPWSGYRPEAMANIHGFLFVLLRADPSIWLVALFSACVFFPTVLLWRNDERGFAAGIVMTVLTSYHANPHDLVLLLLPLAVAFRNFKWCSIEGVTVLALGLPIVPRILVHFRLLAPLAVPIVLLWYSLLRKPIVSETQPPRRHLPVDLANTLSSQLLLHSRLRRPPDPHPQGLFHPSLVVFLQGDRRRMGVFLRRKVQCGLAEILW